MSSFSDDVKEVQTTYAKARQINEVNSRRRRSRMSELTSADLVQLQLSHLMAMPWSWSKYLTSSHRLAGDMVLARLRSGATATREELYLIVDKGGLSNGWHAAAEYVRRYKLKV